MFVIRSKVTGQIRGPFESERAAMNWIDGLRPLLADDDYGRDFRAWDITEVEFTADPHDVAPSEVVQMPLGRLEHVYIESFRDGSVQFHGTPYVACGNGSVHYPEIGDWVGVVNAESWEQICRSYRNPILSDQENIVAAITEVVDDALNDFWHDPCEATSEDPRPCPIKGCIEEGLNDPTDLSEHLAQVHGVQTLPPLPDFKSTVTVNG